MKIWGTVRLPVCSLRRMRASSSPSTSISSKETPFFSSSRFARTQYGHQGVVKIFTGFIRIWMRPTGGGRKALERARLPAVHDHASARHPACPSACEEGDEIADLL